MRFLFYSHDGMGLGHVHRHLAIASALTQVCPKAQVLLATGVDEVARLGLPANVDTLKLPGLRKVANNQYASRRLSLPVGEIRGLRSALLQAATESFRPAVVLVDKHPFGAGGEFRAALESAKASGARTVLGLRDILDDPATVRREWSADGLAERILDHYDQVLVYGDESVFDPLEEYGFPRALAARTNYCGYVVNRWAGAGSAEPGAGPCSQEQDRPPTLLGTTGGGEDGFALLQTFMRAAAGAPWKGLAVAGPMLGQQELRTLQQLAAETGVTLHTFIPRLGSLFSSVDGLVTMGGYNTLVEAVSQGVPTVCVPRAFPRTEQLLRAQAFERLGLLRTIHPAQLTVARLRQEITAALERPRQPLRARAEVPLDFNGARHAADSLLELTASVRRSATGRLERVAA